MSEKPQSLERYKTIYFLGIGGIGMSALARYCKALGVEEVKGYDLTPSPLTDALISEGIAVHFEDRGRAALNGLSRYDTLVVYTPAVPHSLGEFKAFQEGGFRIIKRAEALGEAVANRQVFAVAGTHGKTTTSTMLTHLLGSTIGCSAFLGGISANLHSNLLLNPDSPRVVVEADEYDRSFLRLYPHCAIVTSTSPDHLDIYSNEENYRSAFVQFVGQIQKAGGILLYKLGAFATEELPHDINAYSYEIVQKGSVPRAAIYSDNLSFKGSSLSFDWHFPSAGIHLEGMTIHPPFAINVENATAALAAALFAGAEKDDLRETIRTFRGVKRRFEYILDTPEVVYIDDYAHHPEELRATINSLKRLYPEDRILGIFQPHLYSRTRDFLPQFVESLSLLDDVMLLPIYPAREEPIPGVTSERILEELPQKQKFLVERERVVLFLAHYPGVRPRIVVTLGAGNIDRIVCSLSEVLNSKV